MKSPFRYQASETDCFPTTIINALTYLFPMNKISGELIKMVYCSSLDDFDKKGRIQGTKSNTSLENLHRFVPCRINILKSADVNLDKIEDCLEKDGVAICCIYDIETEGHTVLVIKCDPKWVHTWDPYPYTTRQISKHSGVVLMGHNKPLREANIKITRKRFNSYEKKPFSLGEKHRECCLLWRT